MANHGSQIFDDYSAMIVFRDKFMDLLENSGWADIPSILFNLDHYGAISVPLTQIYYDSIQRNGKLELRSQFLMSQDAIRQPFSDVFLLLMLNFDEFERKVLTFPTTFHSKYYHGHESGQEREYPKFLKCIVDQPLCKLYQNGRGTFAEVDYLISLNLRLDLVFSNKDVRFGIEVKYFDHCSEPDFWPTTPYSDPNYSRDSFTSQYDQLLHKIYYGQRHVKRKDLVLTYDKRIERGEAWANDPARTEWSEKLHPVSSLLL